MSKLETVLLSGTYARDILRLQARVRELASALQQQDLRQDGDGDFPRSLVAQPQPDRRVQPRILARFPAQASGDVAQDQSDLAAAADQPDVAGPALQRGLQDSFIER